MSEATLLVTATASLLAAGAFALVGVELARRPYASNVSLVGFAFTVWWFMFAFEALTDGLRVALAIWQEPRPELYFALARLKIVCAAVAIWGLGYYVAYLWTGNAKALWPLAVFALLHGFYFLYSFEGRDPVGVVVGTWSTRLVFGAPPQVTPIFGLLSLLFFFLPPIVFALGLLILARRLPSRTRRFRATAIAFVVIVWNAVGVFQFDPNFSANTPIFALFSALNVVAALMALAAYYPPKWIHDRLGIRDIEEEPDKSPKETHPLHLDLVPLKRSRGSG